MDHFWRNSRELIGFEREVRHSLLNLIWKWKWFDRRNDEENSNILWSERQKQKRVKRIENSWRWRRCQKARPAVNLEKSESGRNLSWEKVKVEKNRYRRKWKWQKLIWEKVKVTESSYGSKWKYGRRKRNTCWSEREYFCSQSYFFLWIALERELCNLFCFRRTAHYCVSILGHDSISLGNWQLLHFVPTRAHKKQGKFAFFICECALSSSYLDGHWDFVAVLLLSEEGVRNNETHLERLNTVFNTQKQGLGLYSQRPLPHLVKYHILPLLCVSPPLINWVWIDEAHLNKSELFIRIRNQTIKLYRQSPS